MEVNLQKKESNFHQRKIEHRKTNMNIEHRKANFGVQHCIRIWYRYNFVFSWSPSQIHRYKCIFILCQILDVENHSKQIQFSSNHSKHMDSPTN